jgi:hypothetical protein
LQWLESEQRRGLEALRHEHGFADDLEVWHAHRNRPEQRFDILRELRRPEVPRVHRNEDPAVPLERSHLFAELENRQIRAKTIKNRLHLD